MDERIDNEWISLTVPIKLGFSLFCLVADSKGSVVYSHQIIIETGYFCLISATNKKEKSHYSSCGFE